MSLRCIVFDVDDTLYLERDYVRSGFNAVGAMLERERGIPDFAELAWAKFLNGARSTIFDEVLAELGIGGIATTELVDLYRAHQPSIELLEDARECLHALASVAALAVVTDGPGESQHAKIRALGLQQWIPHCIVTADLGPGHCKPEPAAFILAEEAAGCLGAQCAYIADNPHKDFIAPKARGWTTWRVRRPGGLHEGATDRGDVDREFSDMSGIAALVEAGK